MLYSRIATIVYYTDRFLLRNSKNFLIWRTYYAIVCMKAKQSSSLSKVATGQKKHGTKFW